MTIKKLLDAWCHAQSRISHGLNEDSFSMADLMRSNHHDRILRISSGVSGTSVIASSTLIWMLLRILRSYARLSLTENRLLLGLTLSMADILFSLSSSLLGATMSSDVMRNVIALQGFFQTFGGLTSLYYRCSLNLYSLAAVEFHIPDGCIRSKVGKYFHGVPIIVALAFTLFGQHYGSSWYGFHYGIHGHHWPHYEYNECSECRQGFKNPCDTGDNGSRDKYFL